jgi:hypothetical protein
MKISILTLSRLRRGPSVLGLASLALLLSLGGCRKDEKKADTKASADTSAAGAKKARAPADEGIEVPTEEDFEDAVAKQITPDSDLQKELDQLDREISGSK